MESMDMSDDAEMTDAAGGGASPFAAAPPPRTRMVAEAAEVAAAAVEARYAAVDGQPSSSPPAPLAAAAAGGAGSSTSAFSMAADAATAAAEQASAALPPRPSMCRGDSLRLGRASSLAALRRPEQPSIAVFGWGRNDCGQLGLPPLHTSTSSTSSASSPAAAAAAVAAAAAAGPPGIIATISRISSLEGKAVVAAAASMFNSALLTADGELFMLGSNEAGLLGRRPQPPSTTTTSTHDASVAAADGDGGDGDVVMANGGCEQQQQQQQQQQQADDDDDDDDDDDGGCGDCSWQPVRLEALEPYPLADVALGPGHALAVTQQGLLTSWGSNDLCQLGTGSSSQRPQHNPKLLRGTAKSSSGTEAAAAAADSKRSAAAAAAAGSSSSSSSRVAFVRCAAGAAHSLALSSSGRCFTFGQGDHGALGLPGSSSAAIPTHLPGLWEVGVVQVAAGEAHCAVLSVCGAVYTWGWGKYGQLGHGSFEDQHKPREITAVSSVCSIAAGDHHMLLLAHPHIGSSSSSDAATTITSSSSICSSSSSSKLVYSFGQGTFGATGLGARDNVCRPSVVSGLTGRGVVQLAAGRKHSVALTAAGQIFTWGAGDLGQLGLGSSSSSRSCAGGCSSRGCHHHQQQQQQQQGGGGLLGGSSSSSSRGDGGGGWLLPAAQLSPVLLQAVPWPSSCPVLFIAAGGDHNFAVVQMKSGQQQQQQEQQYGSAATTGRTSLDLIAEEAASDLSPAAAAASVAAAAAVSPAAAPAGAATATAAAGVSGPHPALRPYGANLLPLPPPPLLQLATAAAAEAAAARRAEGVVSPEPAAAAATAAASGAAASAAPGVGDSRGSDATLATTAAAAPAARVEQASPQSAAAAAAAAVSHNSSSRQPSAVVLDLAHTVLDVFSSPGLLLQLFKLDKKKQRQQQQQQRQQQQQQRQQQQQCDGSSKNSSKNSSSSSKMTAAAAAGLPEHGLDLDSIDATFTLLLKSYAREVVAALGSACVRLLQELPDSDAWTSGSHSADIARLLLILLQNPLNSDAQHGLGSSLLGLLTALVLRLNGPSLWLLLVWLTELRPEVFGARVVRPVQGLITRLSRELAAAAAAAVRAEQQQQQLPAGLRVVRPGLGAARGDVLLLCRLLDVLHTANVQAGELVPYSEFVNISLSAVASLHEEYYTWLQSGAYRQQYDAFQAAAARATSAAAAAAAQAGGSSSSSHQGKAPTSPHKQQRQQHSWPPLVSSRFTAAAAGVGAGAAAAAAGAGGGGGVPGLLPGGSINSLCEVPFVLTTEAKSNILRDEATLQQQHVVHASAMAAMLQGLPPGGGAQHQQQHQQQQQQRQQQRHNAAAAAVGGGGGGVAGDPLSLTLSLRVRRRHVMEDALSQIRGCGPQELKKPLRVTFLSEDGSVAEEGVDQGGVSRELFQLLVGELFNPDYGMFVYVEESRACWFNPASLESLDEFELVGLVLGLACYNGIIIDAHLPLPAYKKLMGQMPTFADLGDLYPGLAQGLQQLLDFEGDVENTFCRSFEVQYEALGCQQTVELLPGGADLPVTADNRAQFVALYSHWLLNGGVAEQFAAFASGFHRVCGGPALSLFRYEEVELLVEGLPHLDFLQLQAGARYEAGYSSKHTTIQALWSVLLALSVDEKRAFLQFCTGCDRAPVAGLAALRLLIQRAGPDSDNLPTAHTCFNTLLLPDYSSKAKLQQKLMTAIKNAQGFGLQ